MYFHRVIVAVGLCLLFAGVASAQTAPDLDFDLATSTNAAGQVVPTLTWRTTPVASSCTASGDASWTGSKAASGTQALPITADPRTYTMACTFPGTTQALLRWVAPTTNTDGSAYSNPKGFIVNFGASPSALTSSRSVTQPTALTATVTDLTPGTYHFCVRAVNLQDMTSDCSNVVSKVIAAGVTISQTVSLKKPSSPTALTVE